MKINSRNRLEAIFWMTGLVAVAVADPAGPGLINACLFEALGFNFCPGEGLGHAVGHLARGNIEASFQTHMFAVPVIGILLHRIFFLLFPKSTQSSSLAFSHHV